MQRAAHAAAVFPDVDTKRTLEAAFSAAGNGWWRGASQAQLQDNLHSFTAQWERLLADGRYKKGNQTVTHAMETFAKLRSPRQCWLVLEEVGLRMTDRHAASLFLAYSLRGDLMGAAAVRAAMARLKVPLTLRHVALIASTGERAGESAAFTLRLIAQATSEGLHMAARPQQQRRGRHPSAESLLISLTVIHAAALRQAGTAAEVRETLAIARGHGLDLEATNRRDLLLACAASADVERACALLGAGGGGGGAANASEAAILRVARVAAGEFEEAEADFEKIVEGASSGGVGGNRDRELGAGEENVRTRLSQYLHACKVHGAGPSSPHAAFAARVFERAVREQRLSAALRDDLSLWSKAAMLHVRWRDFEGFENLMALYSELFGRPPTSLCVHYRTLAAAHFACCAGPFGVAAASDAELQPLRAARFPSHATPS